VGVAARQRVVGGHAPLRDVVRVEPCLTRLLAVLVDGQLLGGSPEVVERPVHLRVRHDGLIEHVLVEVEAVGGRILRHTVQLLPRLVVDELLDERREEHVFAKVVLLHVVEHVLRGAAQAVVLRDRAVQVHHVRDRAGGEHRRQLDEVVVPRLERRVDRHVRVLLLVVLDEPVVEVALEADLGGREPVQRDRLGARGRGGGRGGRRARGRRGRRCGGSRLRRRARGWRGRRRRRRRRRRGGRLGRGRRRGRGRGRAAGGDQLSRAHTHNAEADELGEIASRDKVTVHFSPPIGTSQAGTRTTRPRPAPTIAPPSATRKPPFGSGTIAAG